MGCPLLTQSGSRASKIAVMHNGGVQITTAVDQHHFQNGLLASSMACDLHIPMSASTLSSSCESAWRCRRRSRRELRTQPNGPVNALGNEVGLSMSDQRWLSSKSCQRKAYLVSFRSETTLGCTAAHRAVAESPEPRAVLGRNALGMPGDCDQARQPLNDTDGGTVKMPCFAALALGFA